MSRFSIANWSRTALVASLMWVIPARGGVPSAFPGEESYAALYGDALNQGYPDIANGVAVFREYRRGLQNCSAENKTESARAFGAFLDGVVGSIRGYLHHPQLRRRSVRESIAGYVTHSSAWIVLFSREKASRFNGAVTKMDAGDERLVSTTQDLQMRVAGLLQVGCPSLEGTIAYWKQIDKNTTAKNPQYGDAARAVLALDPSKETYCKVAL